MKRDWDLLRSQLEAIENDRDLSKELPAVPYDMTRIGFSPTQALNDKTEQAASERVRYIGHLELLSNAGYIQGVSIERGVDGKVSLGFASPRLTMTGHDLLDTMRSPKIWNRIKETAKDKGIELTFDAIKALGKTALAQIIG